MKEWGKRDYIRKHFDAHGLKLQLKAMLKMDSRRERKGGGDRGGCMQLIAGMHNNCMQLTHFVMYYDDMKLIIIITGLYLAR